MNINIIINITIVNNNNITNDTIGLLKPYPHKLLDKTNEMDKLLNIINN